MPKIIDMAVMVRRRRKNGVHVCKTVAEYFLLCIKCNMISVRNLPASTRFPSCSARLTIAP
jgi:hypothetical protein